MPRMTNLLLLFPILGALCAGPAAPSASCQEEHKEFWQLQRTVTDILAGKNVEQSKAAIAQRARIVIGEKYEYLKAVVAGEVKSSSLADTSYQGVEINAATNPTEDWGTIILKTARPDGRVRFHTIVFQKDSTGVYKITVWHAGGCDGEKSSH
jgi:hypothetical protein